MVDKGRKLFAKIHRQKHHANHNHDVHFMARELDDWLVRGVESVVNGSYTPRHLKRHYFPDEMVDQLHLSDRIFQNRPHRNRFSLFGHQLSWDANLG